MELNENMEVPNPEKKKLFGRLMKKSEPTPEVNVQSQPIVQPTEQIIQPAEQSQITISNKGELIELVLSNFSSDEIARIAQTKMQLILQGKIY
jgi:hypothetical protein